jgi:hypothetical protein
MNLTKRLKHERLRLRCATIEKQSRNANPSIQCALFGSQDVVSSHRKVPDRLPDLGWEAEKRRIEEVGPCAMTWLVLGASRMGQVLRVY